MTTENIMNKENCVIIVPTYRERENLARLYRQLNVCVPSAALLVVDDASKDGTLALIQKLQSKGYPIILFQRHAKLGLGTAYTLALAYVKETQSPYAVQMDADFSHQPTDVPRLIKACTQNHIAVGSRYVYGGRCSGWPWYRKILSKTANYFVRKTLKLPIKDATAGFRCIRNDVLNRLSLKNITTAGFAFQCELNYISANVGAEFNEVPITFRQRIAGKSKMSLRIIAEGFIQIIHIKRRVKRLKQLKH